MPGSTHCDSCAAVSTCPLRTRNGGECDALSAADHFWRLPKRRIIYAEGTPADALYMLCSGSVKLVTTIAGDQRIAAIIAPGDLFGVEALVPQSRRSFTAVAREACALCRFDRESFAKATLNIEFLQWLTHSLAASTNQAQRWLILFSGQRVQKRVMNALAECKSKSVVLNRVELAQLLGVSSETLSRKQMTQADTG